MTDLNRRKRLSKRECHLPDCFELRLCSFLAFRFELRHWPFLGLKHPGFWTGTYTIGSPGSQGFGIYLYLYPVGSVSLEKPD